MELASPIKQVPLVGPSYISKLKRLGIDTVQDLIYHFPHRYQDYTLISDIAHIQPGETVTLQGQIIEITNEYRRRRLSLQRAVVSGGEGKINVTWFNQPFLVKNLPPGTWVALSGKVGTYGTRRVLTSPDYEKLGAGRETIHTGRLVPIYPETSGVSSKWLRSRIAAVLPAVIHNIDDPLPESIRKKYQLLDLRKAISQIHFPKSSQESGSARHRLAFDEFFEVQLAALNRRKNWKTRKLAHKLQVDQGKVLDFLNTLPFSLTRSQKKAVREILDDLKKNAAMNRLLEGDVGSGKTVVAALACFITADNGFQSAVMAPTQILALQHYQTLDSILSPLGVRVGFVESGDKKVDVKKYGVLAGTHTLIQKRINFAKLALVVIDEQHRFGVAQRAILAKKGAKKTPHVLTMTATPIPRTVALTLYGDLELSTLDEMPAGRQRIKTWVVPPQKRDAAYRWIRKRVEDTDEQAFIICPLIEESQVETMQSVKAATAEFDRLKKEVFPTLSLGLLHGRTKTDEKKKVMQNLRKGRLDILVATPVVEVGIDIPNATIMMIEGTERFGLAQLHQLRGRVGRGTKQSYCLLFSESSSGRALTRLKAMEKTMSGRELSELDLRLRGPGEIYGTRQHGFPELKIASFAQVGLIKNAREAAESLLPKIDQYPKLKKILKAKEEIAPN